MQLFLHAHYVITTRGKICSLKLTEECCCTINVKVKRHERVDGAPPYTITSLVDIRTSQISSVESCIEIGSEMGLYPLIQKSTVVKED